MNKNMIENYLKICENIKEYKQVDFDHYSEDKEVFDSSLQCNLAYTTKGDNDEFEIQVTLDLKNNRIIKELSHTYDNYIEYDYFKDWEEMATEFEFLNFEDLIMTDVDVDDLLEEFTNRQKLEEEKEKKATNYRDLLESMNKMEYKETIKTVFSFETGIDDEDYLNSMAEYFINDDTIHNFLDVELFEKTIRIL